jgi:Tol biopolymer transport system component
MRADGMSVTNLAGLFISDSIPYCRSGPLFSWSFNSASLAFETGEKMYTVSPAVGSESVLEVTHGLGPVWSADGERIGFTSPDYSGQCAVWAAHVDEREKHDLLFPDGRSPVFAQSGRRVAFFRHTTDAEGGNLAIYVGDADGGDELMLFEHEDTDSPFVTEPAWSPDGRFLAYSVYGFDEGISRIFVLNAEEPGEPIRLAQGIGPRWSPDGQFIVYSTAEDKRGYGVYVARADGSGKPRRIADGTNPDWSPDGASIAFTRDAIH